MSVLTPAAFAAMLSDALPGGVARAGEPASAWAWVSPRGPVMLELMPEAAELRFVARVEALANTPPAERAQRLMVVARAVLLFGWIVPAVEDESLALVGVQPLADCTVPALRQWWLDLQTALSLVVPEAPPKASTEASPEAPPAAPPDPAQSTREALPWSHPVLQGTGVVAAWADELAGVLAAHPQPGAPLPEALRHVGRAAVLQTDNEQVALCCAERIAADLGLPFVPTSPDTLAETLLSLRRAPKRVVVLMAGDPSWAHASLDDAPLPALTDDALQGEPLQAMLARPAGRAALIRWLLCEHGVPSLILLTHVADLGMFSETLSSPGLFDRRFALSPLTPAILGQRFLSELGEDLCGRSLREHPAKVEFLLAGVPHRRRQTVMHQLRRLHRRAGRPLEFSDLVAGHHGHFVERDAALDPSDAAVQARTLVAYHEAGHAVMAMIVSDGQEIPEHATIIGSSNHAGFVLPSLDMLMAAHETYAQFQNRIRMTLAGRAAEDLVFGPEAVTTGAHGDLTSATDRVTRYFAIAGFGPGFTQPGGAGRNLAVWDTDNPHLRSELHQMVRGWLADEYAAVKAALQAHRPLLDATAEALLADPIQDQAELRSLWERAR